MSKKGVVDIHGKQYKTVVLRVNEFRDICNIKDGWGIDTCIIEMTDKWACVKASITNPDGKVVGTGHGVEFWESSNKINKTSALENAETSAVGRALAAIGLGGEEYASADEVINAIKTQNIMEEKKEVIDIEANKDERKAAEVKTKLGILSNKIGLEETQTWNQRMRDNRYGGVKSVDDMTAEQLAEYSKEIDERIELAKE